MGSMLCNVLLLAFVAVAICGCDVFRYKHSTFAVQPKNEDEIKRVVDSAFKELGFTKSSNTLESYRLWVNGESSKQYGIEFNVEYKNFPNEIIIRIENLSGGYHDEYHRLVNQYWVEITNLIKRRLEEAKLTVTVHTDSYWIPAAGT